MAVTVDLAVAELETATLENCSLKVAREEALVVVSVGVPVGGNVGGNTALE